MKKIILISVLLASGAGAVAAGVAYLLLRQDEPEWTSRSPKALKELEQGLEDLARVYTMDAIRHFEEALELDPSLAMAKLHLSVLYPSKSERERLLEELKTTDTAPLNARERFLVAYHVARAEGRHGDAEKLLKAFREQHPDDPYGFRVQCRADWEAQRWDAAERCYTGLLALHPNQVEARNNLGYIAMARGRFDEAEEHFRTYRFVAPDQANPHHSLAELLTLRGRYQEASEALAEVVRIKPDFCAAYTAQVELGLMSGRFELAADALDDLESIEACDLMRERGVVCVTRAWMRYLDGDAEGAWRLLDGACLERREGFELLAHRIAVMTGRLERGVEMEEALSAYEQKVLEAGRPVHARFLAALSAHMQGIRALAAGDLERAVDRLTEADESLGYWGSERASIKLFNRLNLLRALELVGRTPEAAALRREIDAVNPRLVDDLPLPDIDALRRIGDPGLPAAFPLREDQHQ